jgi:predicted glycosyltransferase
MKKRVLFYCQAVFGVGHYVRSRAIVNALHNFEVCFVFGGTLPEGLARPQCAQFVLLPALQMDEITKVVMAGEAAQEMEKLKGERKNKLLEWQQNFRPDIIIIELFPFGRHKFAFELLPLLEQVRRQSPQTKIVCSLRDILVSKRDPVQFEKETLRIVRQYFDLVLVHSDPDWQLLDATFTSAPQIADRIRYTGFVASSTEACEVKSPGESKRLLVSVGGGRVGGELIEYAVAAEKLLSEPDLHRLHLVCGPHYPAMDFERIRNAVADRKRITLEKFSPDLFAEMRQYDLSLSRAGYNTCLDILASGIRAIVIPYIGEGQSEQWLRARKLSDAGRVKLLLPDDLSAERLAEAIRQSWHTSFQNIALNLNGAQATANIIQALS